MTPQEACYRAGQLAFEIAERFLPDGHWSITDTMYRLLTRRPHNLPAVFRAVWPKAMKDKAVLDLMAGFDPPVGLRSAAEGASFWFGFYHQKAVRILPPDFGPRLKALREKAVMSGQDLADAVGLTRQAIHQLEAGTSRPSWATVQALATALSVSTDTFRDADPS